MSKLKGKIDFVLLISATNANPNGDPLNGNRPRENLMDMVRFPMSASKERLGTVSRIWDRRFLCSPMTVRMTAMEA